MKLNDIEELITPLLDNYRRAYYSLSASDIPIIDEINRHVRSKDGKQLRPVLALLTACCCGLPTDIDASHPLFKIAAAIETLHNSTLIHDDVIDESTLRRGIPTVNHLWGNKTAVLAGDYYLAQVMLAVNEVNRHTVTQTINQAVADMSIGELLQQQVCGKYDIEEKTYFDIIHRKTAVFMAASCNIGAIFATDDTSLHAAARQYGENIGMAFQIRDDLIDFLPSQRTGKPQGNDLREHKATLPLIMTLKQCNVNTKNEIIALLEKERLSDDDIATLTETITNGEGFKASQEIMNHYLEKASMAATLLPDNRFRKGLTDILTILNKF
ncbi:MAG: polyprenyl synthetase family protein [Bacteroidales bacterium]|nr:polyprenyl synthetase family protein [Bacteroidales bacterium]MBP5516993.1 polyprenyl synthetase family protein [Bacteroidales bacterium]